MLVIPQARAIGGMQVNKFTKITEEMAYALELTQAPLVDWVDTHRKGWMCDTEVSLNEALIDCESPIEQALSIAMYQYGITMCEHFTNGKINIISVEKQALIDAGDKKYRVDFLLPVVYKTTSGNEYKLYVVECDGHDYHEKTK